MNILGEVEEKYVKMDVELEPKERKILLQYAKENMPKETLTSLKLEWALIDLITKLVEEKEKRDDNEILPIQE